jgi:beta-glucuronidase
MYLYTKNRQKVALDGEWGFLPDPMRVFGNKRSRNIFEGVDPLDENRPIEYDVDRMEPMAVPGDWNTQAEKYLFFEGDGWYARRFTLNESTRDALQRHKAMLCFDGVSYGVSVWLNGVDVGDSGIPYIRTTFDVSSLLKKENLIVVRIDGRRGSERIPSEVYDWFSYSGLLRSVYLCMVPYTFIRSFCFHTQQCADNGSASGIVEGTIEGARNTDSSFRVTIECASLGVSWEDASTGKRFQIPFDIPEGAGLSLWTPENPALYDCTITISTKGEELVDSITAPVGFKTIRVEGNQILLNNRPLTLRGIALHDERIGEQGGRTSTQAHARQLLDYARRLNCNFVRLAHYPYPEYFLDLCDRMGFLVWDEIPVYWNIAYHSQQCRTLGSKMMEGMVLQDRPHPCLLCHSIANETWDARGKKEFLERVSTVARKLDPEIPLAAAHAVPFRDNRFDLKHKKSDIVPEFVDIIGINEYGGWYTPTLEQLPTVSIAPTAKPCMITEFGAAGYPLKTGKETQFWSYEYQCEVYRRQFELFKRSPHLVGITPWVLKDFRTPLRGNGFQKGWNLKGLLDRNGKEKPVFNFLARHYTQSQ